MELTFIQQSTAFLYSIPLGIALGILYGLFKFLRTAFDFGRTALIVSDVLYMLTVSFAVFLFSLAFLLGYIRIYVFFGALLGFLLYRLTLGRLFSKLYCPIILFFRKISHNIQLKFKKIAKKLLKIAYNILYNVSNKRRIFRTKLLNTANDKRVMDSNEEAKAKRKKDSGSSESRKHNFKRDNS